MKRATIKHIAELANVSRGTVDRVLHERPGVNPEVRQRVLDIAEAVNYKTNLLGRSLATIRDEIKIGIILTPEHNPFVEAIKQGIEAAYREFHDYAFQVTVKLLDSLDPEEQYRILCDFEKDGVDGISMVPLDSDLIRDKINDLSGKGIPIVTFNSNLGDISNLCYVGQDHICGGACAGGLLGKLLPAGGKVAVIISSENLICHQERLQGFKEVFEERHPSLEIVSISENADRDDLAFQQAFEVIQKYPDLAGIYIAGGGIFGLAQALKATEKNGKIRTISHDFTENTVELLKDGTLDFALGQNPERQGFLLVSILFDYLMKEEKPSHHFIEMPIEIATGDSIDTVHKALLNNTLY